MDNFQKLTLKVDEEFKSALNSASGESFMRFSSVLNAVDHELREYVQEQTLTEIRSIIAKLKGAGPITAQELALIKLWIVGDAEHYARLENNFEEWMSELKRLIKELTTSRKLDVSSAMNLRGLIYDATRVLSDITYFLQQRERLAQFEESTEVLDQDERRFLVAILETKVNSDEF